MVKNRGRGSERCGRKFEETGVRTDNADFDTKATFKELSFHIGGHLLHSLF